MKIAIRADASSLIGTGHVRRMLALARTLERLGEKVHFVWRKFDIDLSQTLARQGSTALPAALVNPSASEDHRRWAGVDWEVDADDTCSALQPWRPDCLVVDHYSLDARWHRSVRARLACRIVAVEDLGERPLAADLIVDHNLHDDHRLKYSYLDPMPPILGGPAYALLDESYASAPRHVLSDDVRSVGIFMGGVDRTNMTELVLDAFDAIGFQGHVEIVSTSANPNLPSLRSRIARARNVTLVLDLPGLQEFYRRHDLQVGAGGGALLERCCIGSPSVGMIVAENQRVSIPPMARRDAVAAFDPSSGTVASLAALLEELIRSPWQRRELHLNGMALVDGRGIERVAAAILKLG